MKFKKPKNGHYNYYCYECKHWTFLRQVGCAYDGRCDAIKDEPTIQDAYNPPCGLWEKKSVSVARKERTRLEVFPSVAYEVAKEIFAERGK